MPRRPQISVHHPVRLDRARRPSGHTLSRSMSLHAQEARMKGLPSIAFKGGLLLLVLAVQLQAQISGSVVGTVRDTTGAVVPNATITLTNVGTNTTDVTTTTGTGDFRFPLVLVGQYKLNAGATGFGKREVTGLTVVLGQAARADVVLGVDTTMTEVNVSGGEVALQTESAAV